MKVSYSKTDTVNQEFTLVEIEGTLPEIVETVQALDSANNLLKGFGETLGGLFGFGLR